MRRGRMPKSGQRGKAAILDRGDSVSNGICIEVCHSLGEGCVCREARLEK